MTGEQIYQTALRQSAIDCSCRPEDFLAGENRVVLSRPHERARRYLTLPFSCNLVSYGGGVVASVSGELEGLVKDYLDRFDPVHCFETPNLHVLNDALEPHGLRVCFMAEYFLPDLRALRPLPSPLPTRLLGPEELAPLYLPQWGNALCEKRRELDVLAVGAYDGAKLVGLAGCSADCEEMWQIGIDVLPGYRCRGIAAALTSQLAAEVLRRDKVPFYCAAWSNIPSVRNAVKSGFRPAWVEVTARERAFVEECNGNL